MRRRPRGVRAAVAAAGAGGLLLALLSLLAPAARAAPRGPQAPAAPAPGDRAASGRRLLLLPLASLTDEARMADLESLLAKALTTVPGTDAVVTPAELRRLLKKARKVGPESCEGEDPCLIEFGRLVEATILVYGEVSALGGGQVAYVKAVDVGSGKEIGSTTAVFGGDPAARSTEARAAAYRLLAPQAYVGAMIMTVDVAGAVVYVDGRRIGRSPIPPMSVAVGTHALRVTHPQYRDWVRFLDVKFDEATALAVDLTAYPVVSEEMRQKQRPAPRAPVAPLPWYRKPWAVAGVGVALGAIAATIVALTVDGIERDRDVSVDGAL